MPEKVKMSGILVLYHHKWPAKSGPFVRTDSVKFTANSTIGDSKTGNDLFFGERFNLEKHNTSSNLFQSIIYLK